MTNPDVSGLLKAAALPVVAVCLVLAAWGLQSDAEAPRAPRTVAIGQSSYACPAGSIITVAAGQVAAGTSRAADVLPDRTNAQALTDPGAWQQAVVDGAGVIVEQRGPRSGGAGFFAGTAPASGGGGLVVGSCPGVVDDAWFLGVGSGGKHFSTLILTNLGESTAVVDLTLWGPEGQIDAVDTQGVLVDPYSVRRIRVADLAAGEPELAVKVHRRQGALSAVVNDTSTGDSSGTEPISSTREPARDQVIGGIVEGTAGRTLLVLNPASATARVSVQSIGREGTFEPSGLKDLQVEAGALRAITVPKTAGAEEQALRVISDRPVSATVRMAPTEKDYAYAEAAPTLTGPAIVPIDLGEATSDDLRLLLTAPDQSATVDVEAFDASMKSLGTSRVSLRAGTTWGADAPVKGAAYLLLRPDGDVIASATYQQGDRIASLSLTGAPLTTSVPQVRPVG